MMRWYEITSHSDEPLRNVQKSIKEQHLMVRRRDNIMHACISTAHQDWLSRVCTDFGAQLKVLEQPPQGERSAKEEGYKMACGLVVYDPLEAGRHTRWCKKCKEIEGKKAPAQVVTTGVAKTKATVVAKLEPGQDLNLDGVITSLEVIRDQFWAEFDKLDKVLENLKAFRDAKLGLTGLQKEVELRLNAARQLLTTVKL